MKTKVLALFFLASSCIFADWRVGFGVGIGPVYVPPARVYVAPSPYGYYAPYNDYAPYPYVNEYVAPAPYVRGYWHSDRDWDRRHDRDHRRDWDRDHDRDRDHGRRDR